MDNLAPQLVTIDVREEKYARIPSETEDEIFRRVAKGIASCEDTQQKREYWEKQFYLNMIRGAVGAGRIMSAAGSDIDAALINCFVQPVADSVSDYDEHGNPGIYIALKEAADTMRRGGGVGYNFSAIRPKDSYVKSTQSMASGPCSFINVFDTSCQTVEAKGFRRGAQLGALSIYHPDIEEFITAKRTPGRWNNFNVSVLVDNAFMEAKNNNKEIELIHKAKPGVEQIKQGAYQRDDGMWVYKKINASDLWNIIMKSTYDYAEPGILFEDNINTANNLRYVEYINTTNPCGEQPLPPYGCCDLGPVILSKFVRRPFAKDAYFDYSSLIQSVKVQTRFLDNVLDVTMWPLPQQKVEAMNKRRIGIGFTGLGNALAMLGYKYNSDEGREIADEITRQLTYAAYEASVELAKEKGSFPLLDIEKYLEEGTFASTLPDRIKSQIREHGIRNSHLTSIAPVGTISLAFADNASNGIEPPFSLAYTRKKRNSDGTHTFYPVIDHGLRVFLSTMEDQDLAARLLVTIQNFEKEFEYTMPNTETIKYKVKDLLPKSIVTAMDLSVEDHVLMMKTVQKYIDTSISKTVNIPVDYPFEDFKKVYDLAHEHKLKGIATYRPNLTIGSVLSTDKPKEEIKEIETNGFKIDGVNIDLLNEVTEKSEEGELPAVRKKVTYIGPDGKDSFYLIVSFKKYTIMRNANFSYIYRPIEVFIFAQPNDVPREWVDAFARNLALLARTGINSFCKSLIDHRKVKSDRGKIRYGWYHKQDGSKVPKYHESSVACIAFAIQEILITKGIIKENGKPYTIDELFLKESINDINTQIVQDNVTDIINKNTEFTDNKIIKGKKCDECGADAVIKKDGCSWCSNCGAEGACN